MQPPKVVKTTCPYCGVGCGVLAEVATDGKVSVRGDPDHPASFGRLCSKGSALAETIDLDGRLLNPVVHGRNVSWDRALDLVAATFQRTIAEHGPDSVAFYVSGQLLTEDYYVANKLMKGFIGSANIDTNSRLCMASSVAGHRRAFGSDTVPGCYEDLELADLIVLVGSNLAWCHPVVYQRIAAAKEKRPHMKIVLVDPRRTMTADIADLHLAIKPDGDTALFAGLLNFIDQTGAIDRAYIDTHTSGFDDALAASRLSTQELVRQTGLDAETLQRFYQLFAVNEKTVTVFSQGVNQSSCGTDKVNAIINCHLATGRIGKPGCGPFSITGQPNAMGGREVGGLANMLAAHMEIENPAHRDRVQRFWRAPHVAERPGLKAVDMFRAVADGRIKALWIMATNPAVSMPDADRVEAALQMCPFVVVSDVIAETDTMRHAHVRFPATAWGEKDGTVTNSERRISRQRPFLAAPGGAKPDWWIMSEVATRMGHAEAFAYDGPAEIFAEHASLSGFENEGTRDFDIGALTDVAHAAYDDLAPFQWPRPAATAKHRARFFSDGRFYTPDGKARFIAVKPAAPERTSGAFPFVLNTGRVRDHWHTMTRTAKSPRLSQHLAEPFVEIHAADADRLGIADADIVRVETAHGAILVRALRSNRARPGSVFIPMHWSDQFASSARVDTLIPSLTDPISGQPASKNAAVRLERFAAQKFGFAVLKSKPRAFGADYWALATCDGGWRVELAFGKNAPDWRQVAMDLFAVQANADISAYHDLESGQHRFACFDGVTLVGALYLAPEPVSVSRQWAVSQLTDVMTGRSRLGVIAGRPHKGGGSDRGAIVCSCLNVGTNDIAAAVARGCMTVSAIGEATGAGTNCGSCRSEIKAHIGAMRSAAE
jgi:assimilatory nitrate reductase catalytic subunit